MQVQLIVEDEHIKGQVIPVNVSSFIIGRAKGSHLRSPSTHVSRQHCIIHTENNTVTIQDLGGENGTFVNGNRITSLQTLQHGDKLAVGTHLFTLSIVAATKSKPSVAPPPIPQPVQQSEPEPESELMFEVRYDGQLVSVTKNKLFDLARKGRVLPDDLIIIAGTKVFADSIEGIVFGDKQSAAPAPPTFSPPTVPVEPEPVYDVWQTGSKANPFDNVASEPSSYVPPPQRHSFREVTPTIKAAVDHSEPSEGRSYATLAKQVLACILGVTCLVGIGWYLLFSGEKKPEGIVFVEGTLTLDGNPVQGVSVTLNPRSEKGTVAGGKTNSRGGFKVTTGALPIGSGAKPGEYDVTFYKVSIDPQSKKTYEIPQKYEEPSTSGLEPINVTEGGENSFTFTLTTEDTPPTMEAEKVPPLQAAPAK